MTAFDKEDLIKRLKYSSIYNNPCPTWVYQMINSMPTNPEEEIIPAPEGEHDGRCE